MRQLDLSTFVADKASSFMLSKDELIQLGPGHAWTPLPAYDLKEKPALLLEADFQLEEVWSIFHLAFSANAKEWQSGASDALTLSVLRSENSVWIRTGMYQETIDHHLIQFDQRGWNHLRVRLSQERLQGWVNDQEIANIKLAPGAAPASGRIGILGYQSATTRVRNLRLRATD
jgi:hypothetical protein